MDDTAIEDAARLLLDVRAGRAAPPEALPVGAAPHTIEAAHAVQDKVLALAGESVGAMKVAPNADGVMRGAIATARVLPSPATLGADKTARRGIEAEIAFRLDRALPQRAEPYTAEEAAEALTALVVIEEIETRFSTLDAPLLDRLADALSNGALITGTERPDWQDFDLPSLEVVVEVNGQEAKRAKGKYPFGDPLSATLSLINAIAATATVPAGLVITAGSFSGVDFYSAGDHIRVEFLGFGEAELTFAA